MTLSVNDFTAGDVITASAMNTNFATIESYVNSSPGLAQLSGATFSGAVTFSAGVTSTGGTTALGTTNVTGAVTVGVDDTGHDVKFFGASASHWMLWDQAYDALVLTQDSGIYFYDRGGENIRAASNGHLEINAGTTLDLTAPTIDLNASSEVNIDGNVDLNGAIDISGGAASSNNLQVQFAEGYSIHADNDGTGSDSSRLWFHGPDEGEFIVGPRAGGNNFANIRLRATGGVLQFEGSLHTTAVNSIPRMAYNGGGAATVASHQMNAIPTIFICTTQPTATSTGDIWIDI